MTKQLYLAADMAPQSNAEIETALDLWLDAIAERKSAAEAVKLRHASLLQQMANVGCDAYQFVDRYTGNKKLLVIASDPKARMKPAPQRGRHTDDDVDIGDEVVAEVVTPRCDGKVESRRVSRASVEKEIGTLDPFAAVRHRMAESES